MEIIEIKMSDVIIENYIEKLNKVFSISDISSNPECKKFKTTIRALINWKAPLRIYIFDNIGFIAFTQGKLKNNLYELCVREDSKQKGLGSKIFQFFLDNSEGKIKVWKTDYRYDGYKFFTKKGFVPKNIENNECSYEVIPAKPKSKSLFDF